MKNQTINFSGMICYVNDFKISIDDFKEVITEKLYSEESGDCVQIFIVEFLENFLTINFADGSSMPRNPVIYDQITHSLEDNPRNKNQIEPKEYFALIDFRTSFIWLNNTSKKNILLRFLKRFFKNKNLVLKDIYDEDDFMKCIKTLDGIKISAVSPNLFANSNSISQALSDELYMASKAELTLSYNKVNIVEKIKDKLWNILKHKECFKSITISGRDEKNLGMFFNNNLFTRKISFRSKVSENGMFLPTDVFTKLIKEITNEKKYE
jgi:hypothetical protein